MDNPVIEDFNSEDSDFGECPLDTEQQYVPFEEAPVEQSFSLILHPRIESIVIAEAKELVLSHHGSIQTAILRLATIGAFQSLPYEIQEEVEQTIMSTPAICQVCEAATSLWLELGCRHPVCLFCSVSHLRTQIKYGRVLISCPSEGCLNNYRILTVQRMLQPQDTKSLGMFRDSLSEKCLFGSKRLMRCTSQKCAMMIFHRTDPSLTNSDCPRCRESHCWGCKQQSHGRYTCDEERKWMYILRQYQQSKDSFEWIREEVVECPKCNLLIEAEGCQIIDCPLRWGCGASFCSVCLRQISSRQADAMRHSCRIAQGVSAGSTPTSEVLQQYQRCCILSSILSRVSPTIKDSGPTSLDHTDSLVQVCDLFLKTAQDLKHHNRVFLTRGTPVQNQLSNANETFRNAVALFSHCVDQSVRDELLRVIELTRVPFLPHRTFPETLEQAAELITAMQHILSVVQHMEDAYTLTIS